MFCVENKALLLLYWIPSTRALFINVNNDNNNICKV